MLILDKQQALERMVTLSRRALDTVPEQFTVRAGPFMAVDAMPRAPRAGSPHWRPAEPARHVAAVVGSGGVR